jgi:hypothetical protein
MARGNPKQFLEKNKLKRENTLLLIRQAVSIMNETGDILDIKSVSLKTKEIDTNNKGVGEATFRKKDLVHIQSLMIELGIGKYGRIRVKESSNEIILSDQLILEKKANEKLNKIIIQQKKKIKDLKSIVEKTTVDNEELRVKIYEMEMNNKILNQVKPSNNLSN